jgi:hypothetical protein
MARRIRIGAARSASRSASQSVKNRNDTTRRLDGRGIPVLLARLKILSATSSARCRREPVRIAAERTSSSRRARSWRSGTSFTRPSGSSPGCSESVCRRCGIGSRASGDPTAQVARCCEWRPHIPRLWRGRFGGTAVCGGWITTRSTPGAWPLGPGCAQNSADQLLGISQKDRGSIEPHRVAHWPTDGARDASRQVLGTRASMARQIDRRSIEPPRVVHWPTSSGARYRTECQ